MSSLGVAYDPNDAGQRNLVGSILASGINIGSAPTSFSSSLNDVASAHGLNLSSTSDESAAIWYTAQQDYITNTGQSLETTLQQNNYAAVQSGLAQDLPTVSGSSGAPQGLAASLASSIGTAILNTIDPTGMGSAGLNTMTGIIEDTSTLGGAIENWLTRGGLILIGAVILVVALWLLLSNNGILPSPSDTARAAVAAA